MPPKDVKEIEECFLINAETGERISFGTQLKETTLSEPTETVYGDDVSIKMFESHDGTVTPKYIPVFILKLVFGTNNWRRLHGWPQIRYGTIERWKRKYK